MTFCYAGYRDRDGELYRCTRNENHEGPHEARRPDDSLVTRWPNENAPTTQPMTSGEEMLCKLLEMPLSPSEETWLTEQLMKRAANKIRELSARNTITDSINAAPLRGRRELEELENALAQNVVGLIGTDPLPSPAADYRITWAKAIGEAIQRGRKRLGIPAPPYYIEYAERPQPNASTPPDHA